ncbi:transcriptional Coactivator p15-domain-containing protein [Corynascus novoguineensis]|uniref:Transcriptional Coactivator p15-domain-containing protein n=1 Tax=Corynascus novoguineensis TaxID=1126955 RepID=A0AAN7HGT5_9PEZI|nr:transcriptional Coactivator p15-domain-containing protein [Corynascus novoguineensis]
MPYNKKRQLDSESDGEQQILKKSKGDKEVPKDLKQGRDAEGNPYWEIGNNRRIGTSKYRGATLVSIREYYAAPDGELRPGKKGITLSLDQYRALLRAIPELNEQLRSDGHEVGLIPAAEASAILGKADKPTKPKSQKANIDATSDEEEADD